jgi:rSAM/selenodomain-associated transferase 1
MNSVVVFGREPRPGRVKTRLAREIGAQAAAAVYHELLSATVQVADAIDADLVLSLADPPASGWVPPTVPLEIQCDGDLGRRLEDAFERRFRDGYERVVVIGSDCPELDSHHIGEALDRLATSPVVLGPASDGGYWLIGQRSTARLDLSGISWSSPTTLAATRRRLRDLGLRWQELAELRDVDRFEDLQWALESPDVASSLTRRLRTAATEQREANLGR